jgi:hypothetical protein
MLYSSILGSNSIIFRSIGSGISIYSGLFLSQLLQSIINYIKSFSKIGFSDHTSCGLTLYTTIGLFGRRTSLGLLIAKIPVLSKS